MRTALYVAEAESGWIKVGISINPERRRADHAREFRRMGDKLARFEVAGYVTDFPQSVEWWIKLHCLFSGGKPLRGREWFTGVQFDDVLQAMKERVADEARLDAVRQAALTRQLSRANGIIAGYKTGRLPA